MFGWSATVVYARDITDFWMYQIAMLGGTFRSAYELSRSVSNSPTAVFSRLGETLLCNRRQASDVFGAFLSTLQYAGDDVLRGLFSCQECEYIDEDGNIRIKGIVMDGTATGILGQLPSFDRPSTVIEPASDTAKQQYIFSVARLRKFFDDLFRSSLSSTCCDYFSVESPDSRSVDSIERLLFPRGDGVQTEEMKAVKDLISVSFYSDTVADVIRRCRRRRHDSAELIAMAATSFDTEQGPHERGRRGISRGCRGGRRLTRGSSTDAYHDSQNGKVRHKLRDSRLRSAVADFAWSYTTASKPVVILNSSRREIAARKLTTELDIFRWCNHQGRTENVPCLSCRRNLAAKSKVFRDEIPTAVNLALALLQERDETEEGPIRKIAQCSVALLRGAITICNKFDIRFQSKQSILPKIIPVYIAFQGQREYLQWR